MIIPPTTLADGWLGNALASSLSVKCLIIMAVSLLGMLLCLRALGRLGKAAKAANPARKTDGQEGTAMLEFALVLPVLFFFALLLAQATFLFGGNLMVHYAAYTATRTAIVQVPADYFIADGEGRNYMYEGNASLKYQAIRQAAILGVAPVSGQWQTESNLIDSGTVQTGVNNAFTAYGKPVPAWVTALLPGRLRYAEAATGIVVSRTDVNDPANATAITSTEVGGGMSFGPKDAVTVSVTHQFNLSIPFVRRIFGDANAGGNNTMATKGQFYWTGQQGGYVTTAITAEFTLTNEGYDPSLPPKPTVTRQP